VPAPVPALPDVILIQLTLLVAVHVHPLAVVTVAVAAPPIDVKDDDVGSMAYVHGGGGGVEPACDTVTV
jgi:hypothetical protein